MRGDDSSNNRYETLFHQALGLRIEQIDLSQVLPGTPREPQVDATAPAGVRTCVCIYARASVHMRANTESMRKRSDNGQSPKPACASDMHTFGERERGRRVACTCSRDDRQRSGESRSDARSPEPAQVLPMVQWPPQAQPGAGARDARPRQGGIAHAALRTRADEERRGHASMILCCLHSCLLCRMQVRDASAGCCEVCHEKCNPNTQPDRYRSCLNCYVLQMVSEGVSGVKCLLPFHSEQLCFGS